MTNTMYEKKLLIDSEYLQPIFGKLDEHVKHIEKVLNIKVVAREDYLKLTGAKGQVEKAYSLFNELKELTKNGQLIDTQLVEYTMSLIESKSEELLTNFQKDLVATTYGGKPIKVKTKGQKQYIDAIRNNMVVFGIGPAGTGKTYLAMAMAVQAFRKNEVSKIILTRPAIEAGEKLGFLPGDLQSKVDPYLRPLYDALFEIMGPELFEKNMEKGLIEVAPLAYMRGRTLNNAFVVLDEAQNTTPQQMKMFLTRLGFNCKAIVTGDLTQIDLGKEQKSGLKEVQKILKDIEGISFIELTRQDVVRHPLVQKIVDAYDIYENKPKKKSK